MQIQLGPAEFSSKVGDVSGKDKWDNSWSWDVTNAPNYTFTYSGFLGSPPGIKNFSSTLLEIKFTGGDVTSSWGVFDGGWTVIGTSSGIDFNFASLSPGDPFTLVVHVDPSAVPGFIATWAAVPEPSVWAMMLTGFGVMAFAGYRRTRAST